MVRITGPNKTGETQKTKKKDGAQKTGDSSFESMVSDTGGTSGSSGAAGAGGLSPAASLEALLSLQEAGDMTSEEAKARAKKRANEMLDKMEEIRMGLLMGGIPQKSLQDLSRVIQSRKDEFTDPQLKEIMDEIDLRAQVELAKYQR